MQELKEVSIYWLILFLHYNIVLIYHSVSSMDIFEMTNLLKKNPPRSYWEIKDFIKRTSTELALTLSDNRYDFGYEIITEELVNQLSDRIVKWLPIKDKLTVMEVGAWNGRLALNLQKKLDTKAPGKINVVAIDNNREHWGEKIFPIDNTTFAKSAHTYKPDIVVCSRMPQYITPELIDKWRHLFLPDEYIRYKKQAINDIKDPSYVEQTKEWRKYPGLLEYILVGPMHSCGDGKLSYGVKEFPPRVYDPSTMQRGAKTAEIEREEKPVFHTDWFLREELTNVLNLNIFDFLEWKKFTDSSSSTHSFVNVKYVDRNELDRLNGLHDKLMLEQKQRFANK